MCFKETCFFFLNWKTTLYIIFFWSVSCEIQTIFLKNVCKYWRVLLPICLQKWATETISYPPKLQDTQQIQAKDLARPQPPTEETLRRNWKPEMSCGICETGVDVWLLRDITSTVNTAFTKAGILVRQLEFFQTGYQGSIVFQKTRLHEYT